MALSPADKARCDKLAEAASTLKEHGRSDLAEFVEFMLTTDGHLFSGRLLMNANAEKRPALAMRMPASHRDLIKQRVRAAGSTLDAEITEAMRAFMDGTFTPKPLDRAPHGTGDSMVNLNVRPQDHALRKRVEQRCEELREEGQRIYVSTVAIDWLYRKCQIGRYAPADAE
ncbi:MULTISPECIES: hypothetical protein [unclassified Streptomyces]|uniref:hypothetical protein n=1 Tax=unclassified Streptomyces TaxID=2593676 RepID=UPI0033C16306